MAKISKAERFLTALYDSGGEMTRKQLSVEVFKRNLSRFALDELLSSPDLLGLISVTRSPRRDRQGHGTHVRPCGQHSWRYFLTVAGWTVLASGLRRGVTPLQVNTEQVQHWFESLIRDKDPWASELARQAARGREWEALERHNKEQARAARKAIADARVRQPSAKRNRSAADRAARQQFFDAKMTERGLTRDDNGKYRIQEAQAVEEMTTRAAESQVQSESHPSELGDTDYRRDFPPTTPPSGFAPPMQPMIAPDKHTASLLTRIAAAGYRVQGNKVLFSGLWIDPHEFERRMPGCLD